MSPNCQSFARNRRPLSIGFLAVFAIACASPVIAQSREEPSRQIVLDEFTKARPPKSSASGTTASNGAPGNRARPQAGTGRVAKRPTYHRAGGTPTIAASNRPRTTEELGITVWRLRPSRANDSGGGLLVIENGQSKEWTPERIEVDAPLNAGDRVRISVESPRAGYLYVVDREQYAEGSLGDAYLIFPTQRTRGGDNRLRPGKLIDIPAQEDNPSYFTLVPSPSRSDQVAEVLSFIVTPAPLGNVPISDKPLKVSKSEIAKWEMNWSSDVERFEMNDGAGRAWTKEEKAASASSSTRLLTQEEPAPQTIYRIVSRSKNAVLITVPLRYVKSRPQ